MLRLWLYYLLLQLKKALRWYAQYSTLNCFLPVHVDIVLRDTIISLQILGYFKKTFDDEDQK